jgi:diaminopimelate epimerase
VHGGTRRFSKLHGLGNDFVVAVDLDGVAPIDGSMAVALCDRHTGVGADGLLHVDGHLRMTLFNADGSRAEMSGNGIRCLAHALSRAQGVDRAIYDIVTDAGVRQVELEPGREPNTVWCRVDMGVIRQVAVPGSGLGAEATMGVDVGNPHLVARFANEKAVAAAIARSDEPDRNVEFIAVLGPDRLFMRVIERGVGETLACGTGATAAAWAAYRWGLVGEHVTVVMPGGEAIVELGRPVRLAGPSVHVADLEVPTSGVTGDPGPTVADPVVVG